MSLIGLYIGDKGMSCNETCVNNNLECFPYFMYYFENGLSMPEITNYDDHFCDGSSNDETRNKICTPSKDLTDKVENYDPSFNVKTKTCQGYVGNETEMNLVSDCLATGMPEDIVRLCVCLPGSKCHLYVLLFYCENKVKLF